MLFMTHYNQGDILLVPFPFTNQQITKRRPAVVVSGHAYNQAHRDIILAPITSQVRPDRSTATLIDWQQAGLVKPSVVKPILSSFDATLVIRQLGKLSSRDLATVRELFKQIMDLE
jgi:mRNA interferase MazF